VAVAEFGPDGPGMPCMSGMSALAAVATVAGAAEGGLAVRDGGYGGRAASGAEGPRTGFSACILLCSPGLPALRAGADETLPDLQR
jgi:hypothetical protein